MSEDPEAWTDAERQEELDHAVAAKVQHGARVEAHSGFQAVVVVGKPVNHVLHFLLGLGTAGLWWLVVWLPLLVSGDGERRIVLTVDDQGRVAELRSGQPEPVRPSVEVRRSDGRLM